jgi:hypothetical protein
MAPANVTAKKAVTLPPITRQIFRYRYSRILALNFRGVMRRLLLTKSFQYGTGENRESWNNAFPRQVFSTAMRSCFMSM